MQKRLNYPEEGKHQLPLLDIVIPNYNGKKYLQNCLKSIFDQPFSSSLVTVVDNGSNDGSAEYVEQHYPEVVVLSLSENRGFSAAVNAGIRSGSAPLVFLLNNDTELAPDCLKRLVEAAAQFPNDAFFAPRMLSYTQRSVLDGAGDGFLRGGVGYRLGTMETDGPPYNVSVRVFGSCGGASLYRRSMLEQTGLFDENFFAYLEDVDLNFRANRAGFTCRYLPDPIVYHIGSATTGSKINAFTVRLSTRNNFFLLVKNYPFSFMLRYFPVIVIYQLCWLLFVIKKRQFPAYCSGIAGFARGLGGMMKKRAKMAALQTITNDELDGRIKSAERDVVASIMRRRAAQGKGNVLLRIYEKIFL